MCIRSPASVLQHAHPAISPLCDSEEGLRHTGPTSGGTTLPDGSHSASEALDWSERSELAAEVRFASPRGLTPSGSAASSGIRAGAVRNTGALSLYLAAHGALSTVAGALVAQFAQQLYFHAQRVSGTHCVVQLGAHLCSPSLATPACLCVFRGPEAGPEHCCRPNHAMRQQINPTLSRSMEAE